MAYSNIIIAIVVTIVVVKLVAVHLYLKTKINQDLNNKNDDK